MVLLLQLNGELPDKFPGHERRLYVFGCRRSTCRRRDGSIRAVRGIRVWKEEVEAAATTAREKKEAEEEEEAKRKEAEASTKSNVGAGLGEALFGATAFGSAASGGNPFASGGGGGGGANPFGSPGLASNPFSSPPAASTVKAEIPVEQTPSQLSKTFAETLSINVLPTEPPSPPEPWPDVKDLPAAYPTLYLADADFETLDTTPDKIPTNARIEAEDAPEPSIIDKEAFESAMDSAFQKFADRLSQNPEQAIRYEFGGTPLLYSKTDAVGQRLSSSGDNGIPRCGSCGGGRVFEIQLTPHAITELEEGDLSLEGMEWGTVIVGVCGQDCTPRSTEAGEAGYVEEWAGVQWEELVSRK